MQMKEVCGRTGLTERAVRLYIEKELVHPAKTWRNGREYLDFQEADLRQLERVALLRRCFFTLDQIGTIQTHPEQIPAVLGDYRAALRAEASERAEALDLAERIQEEEFADWEALARRISQEAARRALPERDVRLDFGRLDQDSPKEREAGARQWQDAQPVRERKRRFRAWIAGIGAGIVLLSAGAAVWSWYRDNHKGYTLLTNLLEVEVLDKGVDISGETGVMWLDIRIPRETAEAMGISSELRLTLDGGTEAYLLWEGAVYDHAYPMARLEIFIPNRRLRELELGDWPDAQTVLDRVLRDPGLTAELLRLTSFQGEYD